MNTFTQYWFLFTLPVFFSGCASFSQPVDRSSRERPPQKENSYYTSAYPTRDISTQLESIQRSVKRISSTAIYQTYYFDDQLITEDQLKSNDIRGFASSSIARNESTAGTAFAIARNNRSIALLTCAHVIDFPDTLISYVEGPNVPENEFIQSITIRRNQTNLLHDLPNIGMFDILAQNDADDLALIEVNLREFNNLQAPPLPVKIGNPEQLRLGSNIMIMGYPKGYPMVTRGIVSDPNRSRDGDFLTDALFNQGISGGIILASRDNYASFEWIGMANTASAVKETGLVPDPTKEDAYEAFDLYTDSIFVQSKTRISYGITQAIPAQKIIRFLKSNERKLRRLGLSLDI